MYEDTLSVPSLSYYNSSKLDERAQNDASLVEHDSQRCQATLLDVSFVTLSCSFLCMLCCCIRSVLILNSLPLSLCLFQVVEEIKQLYVIAIPMKITGLFIYGKSAVSMFFMGKIGKETLAGGSLAISIANISGYSVISGLAMGMKGYLPKPAGPNNGLSWVKPSNAQS